MNLRRKMKADAREMLRGRRGTAAVIVLISALVFWLVYIVSELVANPSGAEAVINAAELDPTQIRLIWAEMLSRSQNSGIIALLGSLIFIVPLSYGVAAWYYELTFGGAKNLSYIFCGYDGIGRLLRIIGAEIIISIRLFFITLLVLIPALVAISIASAAYFMRITYMIFTLIKTLAIALFAAGICFAAVVGQRYMLVPYLLAEDKTLTARNAIKKSIIAMKGYKRFIFKYYITMIPQLLLCIFIIPIFFIEPKIQAFLAIFARYRIEITSK